MPGKFFCWVSGCRHGDGSVTSLRGILFEFEHQRWTRGDFEDSKLFALSGHDLARRIHENDELRRHRLPPLDVALGDLEIYCVQSADQERLILRLSPDSACRESFWSKGRVWDVCEETTRALQEHYAWTCR